MKSLSRKYIIGCAILTPLISVGYLKGIQVKPLPKTIAHAQCDYTVEFSPDSANVNYSVNGEYDPSPHLTTNCPDIMWGEDGSGTLTWDGTSWVPPYKFGNGGEQVKITATCGLPEEGCTDQFILNVGAAYVDQADITSADYGEDNIDITLLPYDSAVSGQLTLKLLSDEGDHVLLNSVNKTGGSHSESFDVPNLPSREFTYILATWDIGTGQVSETEGLYEYHIRVLGDFEQTCYITADLTFCASLPLAEYAYFTEGCGAKFNCPPPWIYVQSYKAWLDSLWLNGSGMDEYGWIYSRNWACVGTSHADYELRLTNSVCPECDSGLAYGDVAIQENRNDGVVCNDTLYVYGHGTHVVKDKGGALEIEQLDHYTYPTDCSKCTPIIPNKQTRKTVKIGGQW